MNLPIWNSFSRRKRNIILWAAGLLLFYTVAGFLILPVIVRRVAVKELSQQLDREAAIQSVKINPFALSASVQGLLIKDKDGEPFVSWDDVYVNFQLSSFFGRAWVFKEISVVKPFVRGQMNEDGTFNFSDLITKFSASTNAAPKPESTRPLVLHIGRLHISGATAAVADFTPRTPFKRTIGPLNITLDNFRTDPDNKNPYAFAGTTDAGEQISWSGFFYLNPLHSQGELKLFNFSLNKYAPLYQDFVKFVIRDGVLALDLKYHLNLNPTNRVCSLTNSAIGLRDFRLGEPGASNDIIALPALAAAGISADLQKRQATVNSVMANGATITLARNKDAAINVVELSKPAATDRNEGGGIMVLLQSVTNAVATLLNSTNQWSGLVRDVSVTNCAVHFEDDVYSRPATLGLDDIALTAKNLSNLPGTNLEAQLALRWNTNGSIKVATAASFLPPTADVQLDLDQLDLGTLDPYLEPKLNLFILGSKVGLHGVVQLRTAADQLPNVHFAGDASLDGFHTVDGVFGEDLVKWDTIQFNDIEASLNPMSVAIREIDVNNAFARLVVETNHTINLLNALRLTDTNVMATNKIRVARSKPAPSAQAKAELATNAPLPDLSIGAIVITNTALSFSDRSIKPEVKLSVREVAGHIAGLSTRQRQHADLALGAMVDGVGPASITGTLNPFNEAETNRLKISLQNMDLTAVSPYAGKFAGYRIAEGKLNLDLAYEVIGKKLESKNVITIDQFNFGEKVDSPDATHLPVRLAVAIMKDREGKIVLDVPVEGRIDDPKFRISKVVWRAVENILVKTATSPFSLLGAMFGGGGEELGYQEFALGSAELTPADRQKLDTLQKALQARPALRLEITGGVDPDGDREGLQRAALDRQIRTAIWQKLNQTERATNSVEQLVVAPETRAKWVKRFYDDALASGKITPEFIAAHTNLAMLAAEVLPKRMTHVKGATLLLQPNAPQKAPAPQTGGYQTKLVPPPDAYEAVLLATIPVADEDFEALATARATNVRDYLVEHGKVDVSRLFLKSSQAENLRKDGSRAWLQLQ